MRLIYFKNTLDKNNKFKNIRIYNIMKNLTYNLSTLKDIKNTNNGNNMKYKNTMKYLVTIKATIQKNI